MKVLKLLALTMVFPWLLAPPTWAQTSEGATGPSGVNIQRRTGGDAGAPITGGLSTAVDVQSEMRMFIQNVAAYARSQNPRFLIVARGGLELLSKRNLADDTLRAPARTYMRSLDGLMVDAMFVGRPAIGQQTDEGFAERMHSFVNMAQSNGLRILTLDLAREPRVVDAALRAAAKEGYAPAVVHAPVAELTELPPYPSRPFNENPKSVLSLKDVRNYAYIANSSGYGRQDEFALKLHGTNYDLIIVDVFHGRQPLSRRAVETLKYKKLGAKRLVLARMNIGAAASYQFYWQQGWREGSPSWITAPMPTDPDRFFVEYWRPAWQDLIFGNPNSYVFGLVRQGFDGVVLEGLNTFKFFESGADSFAEALP